MIVQFLKDEDRAFLSITTISSQQPSEFLFGNTPAKNNVTEIIFRALTMMRKNNALFNLLR